MTVVSIQSNPCAAQTRIRKTTKNAVSQVKFESIECYARSDIPCGSARCTEPSCSLRGAPASVRKEILHYVLPSKEAIVRYLDCFEADEFGESEGLVVLQSQVMRIERGKKMLLARLRKHVRSNKRRSVVLFDDVHHVELLGMGLREVAAWYERHVGHGIECTVLDDDASIDAYFDRVWQGSETVYNLYESQFQRERGERAGGAMNARRFQLSSADIGRGIDQGRLVRGFFDVDARRSRDRAWIVVDGERVAVVTGREDRWHAIHGDMVVAEFLGHGGTEDGIGDRNNDQGEGRGDAVDDEPSVSGLVDQLVDDTYPQGSRYEELNGGIDGFPRARIVHVPDQSRADLIVSIAAEDAEVIRSTADGGKGKQLSVLCIPFDYRYPKMRLRSTYLGTYVGKRLLVRVIGWDDDSMYPNAHIIKALGATGDMLTETTCILHRYGIEYGEFSQVTLDDLPDDSYRVEDEIEFALAGSSNLESGSYDPAIEPDSGPPREDFRSRFVVSIDPPGCTDVDDAFHVRILDNDVFELGIHIADVTHFLRPGTALDEEALFRSTTVYLVDRRLNMLPARISEDLASLLCERPRFAVSVVWHVSRTTMDVVGEPWFGRSVIQSRYQLEYANAQAILDGSSELSACGMKSASDLREMRTALGLVQSLAWKRLRTRLGNGAIELDSQELRFDVDTEGLPSSLHEKKTVDSMKIVAELMILANEAVATQLYRSSPSNALLRCHSSPDAEKLQRMREFCAGIFPEDNAEYATLFSEVQRFGADLQQARRLLSGMGSKSKAPKSLPLLQMTANRCLSEAQYVRAASAPSTRHFGLAIDLYTHFTSPIRRYADVIVHRQLLASLEKMGKTTTMSSFLKEHMVDTMNERNRASKLAQRECTLLYLLLYLAKSPQTEQAIIQEITGDGCIHVYVPRFELKGRILPGKQTAGTDGDVSGLGTYPGLKIFDTVWVRLEAHTSSCHGPTLVASLADQPGRAPEDVDHAPDDVGLPQQYETAYSDTKSPSPRIDPVVKLLQDISLSDYPGFVLSASPSPVIAHPKNRPNLPPDLTDAINSLLSKSRVYQQRALRALNSNNRARHDKWHHLAQQASNHATRILEYHYNNV